MTDNHVSKPMILFIPMAELPDLSQPCPDVPKEAENFLTNVTVDHAPDGITLFFHFKPKKVGTITRGLISLFVISIFIGHFYTLYRGFEYYNTHQAALNAYFAAHPITKWVVNSPLGFPFLVVPLPLFVILPVSLGVFLSQKRRAHSYAYAMGRHHYWAHLENERLRKLAQEIADRAEREEALRLQWKRNLEKQQERARELLKKVFIIYAKFVLDDSLFGEDSGRARFPAFRAHLRAHPIMDEPDIGLLAQANIVEPLKSALGDVLVTLPPPPKLNPPTSP